MARVLIQKANELAGGDDALLIIDDTALVKKGRHSAGVCNVLAGLGTAMGED